MMIRIIKGQEPAFWIQIRQTPGITTFADADTTVLRRLLLKEQGGLCGYCMRRIRILSNKALTTRIEHIKPQSISIQEGRPKETLSYYNMILCCDGDIDNNGVFHCDRSKANSLISFSPFDNAFIDTLSYSSKDGVIKSSNDKYDGELNKVLNLNHPRLATNRYRVLKGVILELEKKPSWKKSVVKQKLDLFASKSQSGEYEPYCGIVIWFLQKKLQRMGV